MEPPRATRNVLQVYAAMLANAQGKNYALELSKQAKVNIGTIYALMARLENTGMVTSQVEEISPALAGRPPRRYYTLTGEGQRIARSELEAAQKAFAVGGIAYA